MAATINADSGAVSGSAGVKTTADTSGVLALQSNGATGLTLGTDLNVTLNSTGALTLPSGTTAQRPSSPVNGMTRFNTTLGSPEWYSSVANDWVLFSDVPGYSAEIFAWGGGGGGSQSTGGGGGAAYGTTSFVSLQSLAVVIGGGGAYRPPNSSPGPAVPGGGGVAGSIGFSGQGGGYSGIFLTSATQANAWLIAGGGGGSGYNYSGGAGGGAAGVTGSGDNSGTGGTQSAGGLGGNSQGGGTDGSALQGGTSGTTGDLGGGGGGGGGYWGGGAGWNGDTPSGNAGGGGGSAFFKTGTITGPVLTAGSGATPGDVGNSLRGSYGNGGASGADGTQGVLIIRYLGAQRGTGGTVTSSGGYTYHTFTTAGTYTA